MSKKHIRVVVGVIENSAGEILIARRQEGQHLAGLWEFPGGKIEDGEAPEQALDRELKEEINLSPLTSRHLFQIDHEYPEKRVSLFIFYVNQFEGEARGLEGQAVRWVLRKDLPKFDFPEANKRILDYLLDR